MQAFENYLKRHTPLTGEQISVLKQELKEKTYQKGKILLREGESTGLGYFVCSGLLRAYTLDSQGKEHTIQFAPEDWWLGDRNSFYFHEPAAFNIDVLEETQVVIVTKNFNHRPSSLPFTSVPQKTTASLRLRSARLPNGMAKVRISPVPPNVSRPGQ
ncbi:cyclic nucleotide-binding domain-containing protein [Olivibacter sp. 47]|uniref:Crp/Fnr family transcriptional regulator n=1 Tax=Olivibacter sp. 47 TaxID=3056486 RepID=UPI0025A4CBFF|nr:cyclic nucleotide-binding domain-containing protein [Olivibacter sp. 47]MDM8174453.1 cyclic nucleotide-binding domain-containing protein [Olivibacter sp. 47]